MSTLHLVERLNNVHKVPGTCDEWESGYWAVSHGTAERLVGGALYLHSGQNEPSHFGGRILSWRIHRDGSEIDGRIVFRIRASIDYKGVLAGREGWGNEKKIDW